jgi:hypothetical protein
LCPGRLEIHQTTPEPTTRAKGKSTMPADKPKSDTLRTAITQATAVAIAGWFGLQLVQHHMPAYWVGFGVIITYLAGAQSVTHYRKAWRNMRAAKQTDQNGGMR